MRWILFLICCSPCFSADKDWLWGSTFSLGYTQMHDTAYSTDSGAQASVGLTLSQGKRQWLIEAVIGDRAEYAYQGTSTTRYDIKPAALRLSYNHTVGAFQFQGSASVDRYKERFYHYDPFGPTRASDESTGPGVGIGVGLHLWRKWDVVCHLNRYLGSTGDEFSNLGSDHFTTVSLNIRRRFGAWEPLKTLFE